MQLTVHTFVTLDGVMQGPGAAEEDSSGSFDRGGWLVPYADEGMGDIVEGWFAKADAILLGRTTFELMKGFWPQVTDPDNLVATKLNHLPKFVASDSLQEPGWGDTTVLSGDVLTQVARLKGRPGSEIQVHGSCALVHALHDARLIDEYRLLRFPVVVGQGKKLFRDDAVPSGFVQVESRSTSGGLVYSALTPTPFKIGTVDVADGKETW